MACIKDYDVGSRRYNVISEYLELNNKISDKSRYVFDLMFEFILSKLELKLVPKPHSKLFNKLTQFMEAINECQPSEILNYIRIFGKDLSVTYEDLVESVEEIPEVLLWSPVPALEKMFDDFYENGYGTTFMSEYFKDESKSKKLIKSGKQTEFDQPCLLSLFLHSDNINHSVLKYCSGNFNDKFAITNPNKWIDIMVEFGYDKKMRGIDYEFRNYVTKFSKLTKFWDVYKSQNISNGFINNQFLMFGGNNENNDLFKIYEGNYNLVKEIPNPVFNDADACKLICDWNAFNKLSPHKQKCVKAYLTQNINYINNFIQRGAEKIYTKLNKARNTSNYMGLLNKYIKQKSYYNTTKLNDINTIQQTLNTRMNNAKFNTISDAMEFIVHQYIPLLRNYKKSPIFNAYTNNVMNNSDVLSVIGVADYIDENEPLKEVVTQYKTEVKYVDRPVTQYKTEVKYVDRPIVMRGGDDNKQQNSTERYINDLVAFQKDFNIRYCEQWRSIVNKLKNISGETINKDANMTISVVSLIRKVLIYNTKTTYYISGLFTTKNINKQYTIAVENLISTIESNKIVTLDQIVENLKQIANLCVTSSKRVKELKNKYISSGSTLIDQFNFGSNGRLKIENNLTLEEIRSMDDTLKRIERNIIENRGHNIQASSSANMLKDYINKRADKNKIIDNYFDSIENNLKYNLESDMNTLNNRELYLEGQSIIGMRLLINKEMKKCYKWLNTMYDVMLSKNRLEQMRNKVLSESVLHKIEKAYLDFNSYDRSSELQTLMKKFEKYTENPNKFKSFFKIAKLAKKCIENVNLLGYVERLYKELDIINPEFNWNVFKENMISFLVTNMIRVDIFVLKDYNDKTKFNLVNMQTEVTAENPQPVLSYDNALYNNDRNGVNTNANYGITKFNSVLNCNTELYNRKEYTGTDNIFAKSSNNHNYYLKRRDWLKLSINEPTTVLQAQHFYSNNSISYLNLYELLHTNPTDKIITYGFSLRKNLTNYYPTITDIPIATIQSIYTPIIEVLNKYIEQRYEQRPNMNDALVTKLMYGGNNKISAGSIFDIIDPKPVNNDTINVDAIEFYISAYYIIGYYFKIIDHLNSNVTDEKKDVIKEKLNAKIKFFKISPLYGLDNIFKSKSKTISSLKPFISTLNDYWDSIEESNPKTKTSKVIDALISEINASIIYGSPDEINTFNETILSGEMDFYAFNFEKLNNTMSITLKKAKEYLSTFAPSSMTNLNKFFDKYTGIIKNALPNERIHILENILLRNDSVDFDEYNNFCELCITPFILIINYYLNILYNTYKVFMMGGSAKTSSDEIRYFIRQYIMDQDTYEAKESPNGLNLIGEMDTINSILVTFYDFILSNKGKFDKENDKEKLKDFFVYLLESFKKDVSKVVLLRMNYPGYSDVDIAAIKTNVLDYYEGEIKKSIEAVETQIIGDKLTLILNKFKGKNNLIPELQIGFENNILNKRLMDPKYPFIPSVIDISDYKVGTRDNSFTKFITIMLAVQHPDYYLPQTYVTLLESSPLYGTTCSDIGTSVFTPEMIRSPTKIEPKNKLNILKHFGTTPLTNICLYLSKSETAINKTTTNLMNSYYATNLISAIPNLLKILYQCSKLFDENFYYTPVLRHQGFNVSIDARLEISVLSQILIKLYNEVLPISNNIQFMDYLNTGVPHSFTELIEVVNKNTISFESNKPLNYIEWINPLINTNYGINYDNYDRFEKYNNMFIKPLNDDNFAKIHDEIKIVMAKLIANSLILSTSFVDLPSKTDDHQPLMGGNKIYNKIQHKKIYGGNNNETIEKIINKISRNPRVLALAGVYNMDEHMIKHLFKKLYSTSNAYNRAFRDAKLPIPLYANNTDNVGTITFNNANAGNTYLPQDTSLMNFLHNNGNKTKEIEFLKSTFDEILINMYDKNINQFNTSIVAGADSINTLSRSFNSPGYAMDKPIFDMALMNTLNVTIDYLNIIHQLDYKEALTLGQMKLSPIIKRMFICNDLVGDVHTNNFNPKLYNYEGTFADINASAYELANALYDRNEVNNAAYTCALIIALNKTLKYEKYLETVNAIGADNYYAKKAFLDYLVTISWNEVSAHFLLDEFKKGYDIYYHLFINTIIIASHIHTEGSLFDVSLQKVYHSYVHGANISVKNMESYVASLLSMWSSIELTGDKRISEYYITKYVTDKVDPAPQNQLGFMKSNTNHNKNNTDIDSFYYSEDDHYNLTTKFQSKYLNLFIGNLQNDNPVLTSLGLLKLAADGEIINHYSIGPFPCINTTADLSIYAVAYINLSGGANISDPAAVLNQTIRKCATGLMCNIIFPDAGDLMDNVFEAPDNTKTLLMSLEAGDTITGAGKITTHGAIENNIYLFENGAPPHYQGYAPAARDANGNADISGNNGVDAVVNGNAIELTTTDQQNYLDVGTFINASFIESSKLNKFLTICKGLYLYSKIPDAKLALINHWNLVDEFIDDQDLKIDGVTRSLDLVFAPYIRAAPDRTKYAAAINVIVPNNVGASPIAADNYLTLTDAALKGSTTLVTNGFGISAFAIGKHRRLLYEIQTLHEPDKIGDQNEDFILTPRLYATVFEEENTKYLCFVVGRKLCIEYSYINITQFKLLSNNNPDKIFGADHSNNIGAVAANSTKYPFVSCTNLILIADYDTKPYLVNPYGTKASNAKFVEARGARHVIITKRSTGLGTECDLSKITINKNNELQINMDLDGLLNEIKTIQVDGALMGDPTDYGLKEYISSLFNCCIFGTPLKPSDKILKLIRSIEPTYDDCINTGLLLPATYAYNDTTAKRNIIRPYITYTILFDKMLPSDVLNLIKINEAGSIKNIINRIPDNADISTAAGLTHINIDINNDTTITGLNEMLLSLKNISNNDGFLKNMIQFKREKEDQSFEAGSNIHVINLNDIADNTNAADGIIYSNPATILDLAPVNDQHSVVSLAMKTCRDNLGKIFKDINYPEINKTTDTIIIYANPSTYIGIMKALNGKEYESHIYRELNLDGIKDLLMVNRGSVFGNETLKTQHDKYYTEITNANINMFGGGSDKNSFNLVSDNQSYIEYNLNSLIKKYYYDKDEEKIFKYLMPSQYTDNDLEKIIISYYNKSLLTFTPLFNKYLFVEIIYNSNVLKRFVIDSLNVFKKNIDGDNADTIKYLFNMFTVFKVNGTMSKGSIIDEVVDKKYKKEWLIDEVVDDDESVYNCITKSPTTIGKALKEFKKIMVENKTNAELDRTTPGNIEPSNIAKNKEGYVETLTNMSAQLLDIDKFNLFIGTLAAFVKSIKFYNPRENTFINYTDGKSLGPLSMAEVN